MNIKAATTKRVVALYVVQQAFERPSKIHGGHPTKHDSSNMAVADPMPTAKLSTIMLSRLGFFQNRRKTEIIVESICVSTFLASNRAPVRGQVCS